MRTQLSRNSELLERLTRLTSINQYESQPTPVVGAVWSQFDSLARSRQGKVVLTFPLAKIALQGITISSTVFVLEKLFRNLLNSFK
jgi:hypothetical protein